MEQFYGLLSVLIFIKIRLFLLQFGIESHVKILMLYVLSPLRIKNVGWKGTIFCSTLIYKHICRNGRECQLPSLISVKRCYFEMSSTNSVSFFCGAATQRGSWPLHSWGFQITHNDAPQSVGLLWTSDQLVAETSTWQHTTLTTNIHAPGGIRTYDLSRRAAADLLLRPRGHWDRLRSINP